MIAFCIWAVCAILFAAIGIHALRSKKAVHFFASWQPEVPPEVRDVRRYNRAVARLWFIAAGIFLLLGLPLLAGQNSAIILLSALGTMALCIGMCIAFHFIEQKYKV